MDSDQFDNLVQRLSTHVTRRRSLGALGALGAAGAGLGRETDIDAKKRRKKKKKKTTTQPPGCQCDLCKQETCQGGVCACPAGMIRDANGFCGTTFSCLAAGMETQNPTYCCSGTFASVPGSPGVFECTAGNTSCQSAADCIDGGTCRGFKCPPLYLATVGQQCAARTTTVPGSTSGRTRR